MSQIIRVIKSKNRLEKEKKRKINSEIRSMREMSVYRNRLNEDMKMVRMVLADEEVEAITVKLENEKTISMFMRFIYSEEFSEYVVEQMDAKRYKIRRRVINI